MANEADRMAVLGGTARSILAAATLAAALFAGLGSARADEVRQVVVNGVALSADSIAAADDEAGIHLPDGIYWLNAQTGYWGPVGGPAQGRVGADARVWMAHAAGNLVLADASPTVR